MKAVRFRLFPEFFLLISVMLTLGACADIFTPLKFSPLHGNANVTVNIGGGNERTLLPQPALFDHYDLIFERTDTAAEPLDLTITGPDNSGVISLKPGEWKVSASAYLDISGVNLLAAEGEAEFTATSGNNTNVSIILQMPQTGEEGKFTYEIDLPAGIDISSAFLSLTSLSGGENIPTVNLLSPGGRQTMIVSSGFYLMSITVSDGILNAGRVEVVHIYPGMETIAEGEEYSFDISDFGEGVHYRGTAFMDSEYSQGYEVKLVHIYSDAAALIEIGTAEVSPAGLWSLNVSLNFYRENIYARMELEKDSDILFSKIQGPFAVSPSGAEINLAPAEVFGLTQNIIGYATITINPDKYTIEGDAVEFSFTVEKEGHQIKVYRVMHGAMELPLLEVGPDKYSFTMPRGNVEVQVETEVINNLQSLSVTVNAGSTPYALNKSFNPGILDYTVQVTGLSSPTRVINGAAANNRVNIHVIPQNSVDTTISYYTGAAGNTLWNGASTSLVNGDKVTIKVSGTDGNERNYTLTIYTSSTLPQITAFSFNSANNPNIAMNLTGTINDDQGTISFFPVYSTYAANQYIGDFDGKTASSFPPNFYWWIKDIDHLSLKPTFTVSAGSVTAGDVSGNLTSGVSAINPINNTVTVSSGANSREYRIIFDSPQLAGYPVMQISLPSSFTRKEKGRPFINKQWITKDTIAGGPHALADFTFYNNDGTMISGKTDIKLRGNYTSGIHGTEDQLNTQPILPKLPYALKFESRESILGMPSMKRWNLIANVFDPSSVRYRMALELGRLMARDGKGMAWVPGYEEIMFYLNNEFYGHYGIMEAAKLENIPITNVISPNNPDGAYLLEVDSRSKTKAGYEQLYGLDPVFWFHTTRSVPTLGDLNYYSTGFPYSCADPDSGMDAVITTGPHTGKTLVQKIQEDVQAMENAIFASGYTYNGKHYSEYLDVNSFIDWYLVEEFTMNEDSNWHTSVYIYYDPDMQKFRMGPIWDFDSCMGSTSYLNFDVTQYYLMKTLPKGVALKDYYIYRLFQDPDFRLKVKNRWNEISSLIPSEWISFLDSMGMYLEKASVQNYKKIEWEYNWSKNDSLTGVPSRKTKSHAEEIAYLRNWILTRYNWFNTTGINTLTGSNPPQPKPE